MGEFASSHSDVARADHAFAGLFETAPAAARFGADWLERLRVPATTLDHSGHTPQAVLERARGEAEAILTQARGEAQQTREDAARETAAAVRREQIAAFAEASGELLAALEQAWEQRLRDLEREAALLVTDIARHILHDQFVSDEAAILPVVREALQHLADNARVQVVIAPCHEAAVRQARQELAAVLAEGGRLEVIVAEAAEPGGCLAHGDQGSVDARLGTRLEALAETIQETVEQSDVHLGRSAAGGQ